MLHEPLKKRRLAVHRYIKGVRTYARTFSIHRESDAAPPPAPYRQRRRKKPPITSFSCRTLRSCFFTPSSWRRLRRQSTSSLAGHPLEPTHTAAVVDLQIVLGPAGRQPGNPGFRFSPHDLADALFLRGGRGDGIRASVHLEAGDSAPDHQRAGRRFARWPMRRSTGPLPACWA